VTRITLLKKEIMSEQEDYLSRNDTAKHLNTTLANLQENYITKGILKPVKKKGKIFFQRAQVLKAHQRAAGISLINSGKSIILIGFLLFISVASSLLFPFFINYEDPDSVKTATNVLLAINSICGIIIFGCILNIGSEFKKSGSFLLK